MSTVKTTHLSGKSPIKENGANSYLIENEGNMFSVFDYSPIPILIYNINTLKIVHVNQTAISLYGYSKEEFLSMNFKQIRPKKDIPRFIRTNNQIIKSTGPLKIGICPHYRKDRTIMQMEITVQKIPFQGDSCVLVSGTDVTEKEQINALERLERNIIESSMDLVYVLTDLLYDFTKGLEDIFPGMKASILKLDDNKIFNYASPSLPIAFVKAINGLEIGPTMGSCGTAAFIKKRVIVSDINKDPLWKDYKSLALPNNLRACWSQPIFNAKKEVVATFANYYEKVKEPSSSELELFSRSAALLSIILENRRKSMDLLASNERFTYVNMATNDAIYDWDISTDQIVWGHSFERLFGYDREQQPVSINDWLKLIHGLDRKETSIRLKELLANGKKSHWNNRYRFKNSKGTYCFVEDKAFVIRDSKGKGIRMIGVVNDITHQETEAIKIKVRASLYQIFGEAGSIKVSLNKVVKLLATNGNYSISEIWLVNLDKSKIKLIGHYGNDASGKIFYKEGTDIQSLGIGEGLPGKVWETKSIEIWKSISFQNDFVRSNAAKKSKILDMIGMPLVQNNEFIGVLVLGTSKVRNNFKETPKIFGDLTNLLAAEIKRKQVEIELKQLFETAPDIICQLDFNGRFKRINQAGCQLLGYSEKELLQIDPKLLIHTDDLKLTEACFIKLKSEKEILRSQIRYVSKTGKVIWLSWTCNPSHEEGLIYAVAKNITEEKSLGNLLDMATEMARIGSWEVDLVNNRVYWSKMTKDIHEVEENYEPDLEKGINFYRKDVRSIVKEHIEKSMKNGTSWDLELPIITANGDETWVRAIGKSEIKAGKCIRIYGSFQDINNLKEGELKLKKTLKEKNEILERIGDGFFAINNDWKVKYWNRAAEQLLLVSKETILGNNLWSVFPDATDLPSLRYYTQALETGEVVHFEDYYEPINKWFEVSAFPSKTGLSVFFKDIGDRKLAEMEIKKGYERFEKVAEATSDAIWEWDIKANTLFWGEGFKTLFGYAAEKESPTLESWTAHLHPEDKDRVFESLSKMMEGPKNNHWEQEYRYLKKDGDICEVLDKGVLIRDSNGEPLRMVGAMSDITDRKNYEKSLKKVNLKLEQHARKLAISNEELEQFAYMASHDLQEPLRMVTSFLTQLEKKYSDKLDAKAHQYIDFAVDGAKRMRFIILDLLEYSRVGKEPQELELVDLNEVVKGVLFAQQEVIKSNDIIVQCADLPTIRGFNAPLVQVFHNLISNSIKFRKKNIPARIEILCKEKKVHWEFEVKDNGIGINKEYYSKIFLIFQRLHSREDYSGTGIGLSVVKKIVENFGGTLWVKSQENKGSSFYFTIPKGLNAS